MNTKLPLFAILVILAASLALGQPGPEGKQLKDLNLTDAQKEQFEKISFDAEKKQIDLGAKLATSRLEIRRLMTAESLDKTAIEKKMNEIALLQVALRMNHINAWSEKNKALNADQQKIWKKMLGRHRQDKQDVCQGCMQGPMQGSMKGSMKGRMHAPMMQRLRMDDEMPPSMERKIEKKIIKE